MSNCETAALSGLRKCVGFCNWGTDWISGGNVVGDSVGYRLGTYERELLEWTSKRILKEDSRTGLKSQISVLYSSDDY